MRRQHTTIKQLFQVSCPPADCTAQHLMPLHSSSCTAAHAPAQQLMHSSSCTWSSVGCVSRELTETTVAKSPQQSWRVCLRVWSRPQCDKHQSSLLACTLRAVTFLELMRSRQQGRWCMRLDRLECKCLHDTQAPVVQKGHFHLQTRQTRQKYCRLHAKL